MRRLRVVQILNGLALNSRMGGAERFGVELARHLDPDQIEVIVVGLWEWDAAAEQRWRCQLADEGIRTVVGVPKDDRRPLANFVQSLAHIRSQFTAPVDLLHSQCDFGDVAGLWLRPALGARLLLRTAHNELEWARRPLRRWILVDGLYPFVYDRELGVSQRAVEVLDRRPLARLLRKRAAVLHNAVDTTRFAPLTPAEVAAGRRALGIDPQAPVIGSIGRLTPQKGYRDFLQAAAQVAALHPKARFLLVGDGEENAALRQSAADLQLADRVVFTGARDDVEQLLPLMDLFVSSSLWEGLPTVILEAMLAGVPVVATRVAGTVELIEDLATGRLVPPSDPAELSRAICQLLDSPPQAQEMAQNAQHFVRAHFDIAAVARRQAQMYWQLVTSRADGLKRK